MEDEDLFDLDEVPLYDPDPEALYVECPECCGTGLGEIFYDFVLQCVRCAGTGEVEAR